MRKPNFKYDDEILGKFGEDDFKNYCAHIGYNWVDVSKELPYQLADVDFLISKDKIEQINERRLLFSRDITSRNVFKIEVKTDTRSFKTRNVVYEIISHDSAGCLAESKADFVYYVFVDADENGITKKEAWSLNLPKWREYLREHFFDTLIPISVSERNFGIRRNNYNTFNDGVANLLCNIEKLETYEVAKKIY